MTREVMTWRCVSMRIADQGELEGVGAPTSPRLPLCLADEAGAAHPVGGNLGHPGDVD